ncbi:uncharacterized protein LOC131163036 [Malania oleifera]|uniref:uncharacterized protein LOC131163036 n=1 Tax=Malania oleifera TaxID=397392 RepID=UPI0025AE5630|nr:uncharacterized protein LOC131163036 [Malania oleifera]
MADQRRPFSFRLPWLTSSAPSRRPATESQPPSRPAQPPTTTPAAQPPFRPAGIVPAQPPPPQAPPSLPPPRRTESQPPAPSRAATQFRPISQPAPGSQAPTQPETAQSQAATPSLPPSRRTESQPPAPSRAATQFRPTSQQAPGSQAPTQPAQPPPPQAPPSLPPSQRTESQPRAPSHAATQPPPAIQQEPKPEVSPPAAQEPRPKAELTSQKISQNQNQVEATSQLDGVATQPSKASVHGATAVGASVMTSVPNWKSDSTTSSASAKSLPESQEHSRNLQQEKQAAQEFKNEGKVSSPAHEESKGRIAAERLIAAPDLKMQNRVQPTVAFQAYPMQVEKQGTIENNEALTPSVSHGKQFKTVISTHPQDKNTVSESHQKPKTPNGVHASFHKEIKEDISKFVHKLALGNSKEALVDKPLSVITLTGENRGASMQLGSEPAKKEQPIHIYRGYKTNPDESTEATTDGEESSIGIRSKDGMVKEEAQTKAYINSNVQSVNNSILFNGSVAEQNPGVQLALTHNSSDQVDSDTKKEFLETHKAEFNVTPAQQLTYEPRIRRRCLRGLFMESSDSDPDNPEKPRRHGCKYNCSGNIKDNKLDVL